MIGIIGGGFGLFAWMPALAQYYPNETILMEFRHREKFNNRPELHKYRDRIKWVNIYDILEEVELLVLAIPPSKVYDYLELILYSTSIKKLIVEKPICETPEKSEAFVKAIEDKGIKICSSYLFIYTDWFKELDPNKQYKITWVKNNTNPKKSWKHNEELGGGEIFYKIHLMSLLALSSNIEIDFHQPINDWQVQDNLTIRDKTDYSYTNPQLFNQSANEEDNRIPYLIQLLNDFENNYEKVNSIMHKTNELWKTVEQKLN